MLGLLVVTRLVFKSSNVGKVAEVVRHAATAIEVELQEQRLDHIESEQSLGFNREEEAFFTKLDGGVEKLYPFHIDAASLPPDFETLVGVSVTGDFALRVSEWVSLGTWLDRKYSEAVTGAFNPLGQDARWLLHCGRERWKNEGLRLQALHNALDADERVRDLKGFMKQEL